MRTATALDLASLTSLVLTLLAAEDALTARELAAATGLTTAALRPALRQLVGAGAVVTSGRTSGTRYILAVEEQQASETVEPATVGPTAAPVVQLPSARLAYRSRRVRLSIPATTDLLGDLERTAERLLAGATLHELSARAAA